MIELNNDYDFSKKFLWKPCKKTQIILCHTAATLEHHLIKLSTRYEGNYTKIPHFTISGTGIIYQHLPPDTQSDYIGFEDIDEQAIIVCLENVGWLNYNLKMNQFYDWKGDEYYGEHIERTWRGKRFWAEYKKDQIESLLSLLNYLCKEYSIQKDFTGNNVSFVRAKQFNGILNRSNYNKYYHDLSPAMDFDYIKENLI